MEQLSGNSDFRRLLKNPLGPITPLTNAIPLATSDRPRFNNAGDSMAEYSTDINRRGPFIFDRVAITTFYDLIRKFLLNDRPTVSIGFVGEHSIQSDDIDSLLEDAYVSSRQIVKIGIEGSNYALKPRRSGSITLSSEYGQEVRVSIKGDRDPSTLLRGEIEGILHGCTPWYARLYLPAGSIYDGIRMGIGFVVCWAITVAVPLAATPGQKIDVLFLLSSSGFGLWVLLAWLFLNRRMFPRLLFDIGKSAEKVSAAKYWRNTVFVGIILAVLTGFITTQLTDRLRAP
jgi:hypothetical protein